MARARLYMWWSRRLHRCQVPPDTNLKKKKNFGEISKSDYHGATGLTAHTHLACGI